MRIPILLGATRATSRSGHIPLPAGKFRLEITGVETSIFTINGQPVVDGSIIEGDRLIQFEREGTITERSVTIYAVRQA